MRAIPKEVDLGPLVGMMLAQVRIDPHHFQFLFEDGWAIAGGGTVIVDDAGSEVTVFGGETGWIDASILPKLVGRHVVGWNIEGSHELSITLEGELRLRLICEDSPYEDFVIHPKLWVM